MILGQRLLELLHKAIEISVFIKNIRFRVTAGRAAIKNVDHPNAPRPDITTERG
jgi:hypothetical protein